MQCGDVQGAVFTEASGRGAGGAGGRVGAGGGEEESGGDGERKEEEGGGGGRLFESLDAPLVAGKVSGGGDGAELEPQACGLRVAKQREQVRQAARRGVAFGFCVAREGGDGRGGERRRVEAVQRGRVVEASFAKGEWGVRWKE